MQKVTKLASFTLAIATAGMILAGCTSNQQSTSTTSPTDSTATTNTAPATANAVSIKSMAFTPKTLKVKVGQTVTWKNDDQFTHTVTSDSSAFNSGNLSNGGTFSFTFTKAGTFPYHCNIHTSMTGEVVVTE